MKSLANYGAALLCCVGSLGTAACTFAQPQPTRLVVALVEGDQMVLDAEARKVLRGEAAIKAADLRDDREVSSAVVLRTEVAGRPMQFGPALVSDALVCLLQIRDGIDSQAVLGRELCPVAYECDACNSLTYPLKQSAREALRGFWTARFEREEDGD